MDALALGLPDTTKPFWLFCHKKQGIALGILTQNLGPYRRAVAYFSKQLDELSKGWPNCPRAGAAVVPNIQEPHKFTLGQKITVLVSHTVSAVLEGKGGHWLSPQRFLKYQAILVEQDDVEIAVTNIVNPASFLSATTGEPVSYNCLKAIEAVYSSRPDLKEEALEDTEGSWYADGSSFVRQGARKAGYTVTAADHVTESKALAPKTLSQKAEIIALTRALELAKGKKINIWMDSKYACGVVHAHGAVRKERGLLSTQEKHIKHAEEILKLLEAAQLPEKVVITHRKARQKGERRSGTERRHADREAKRVAGKSELRVPSLVPDGKIQIDCEPNSSKENQKLTEDLGRKPEKGRWAKTPQGKIIIPFSVLRAVVMTEHRKPHLGTEAPYKYLNRPIVARNQYTTIKQVTQQCEVCLQSNPKMGPKALLGQIGKGNYPGQQWQIDFSELPRKGGFQYLLVCR